MSETKERPILFSGALADEEWRPIPGLEGRYEVSSLGRVRTLSTYRPSYTGHVLAPWLTSGGYEAVSVRTGGRRKTYSVHRLVLLAFVGPCPRGHEVAHANGNRTDNRLPNLRYATPAENTEDKRRHGRIPRGSRNKAARLDEAAARTIRKLRDSGLSSCELAHLACVHPSTVQAVWNGENWKHVAEADHA